MDLENDRSANSPEQQRHKKHKRRRVEAETALEAAAPAAAAAPVPAAPADPHIEEIPVEKHKKRKRKKREKEKVLQEDAEPDDSGRLVPQLQSDLIKGHEERAEPATPPVQLSEHAPHLQQEEALPDVPAQEEAFGQALGNPPSPLPQEPLEEANASFEALPQTPINAPTTPTGFNQSGFLGGGAAAVGSGYSWHTPGDQSPTVTRADARARQSATRWQVVDDETRIKELEKELEWEKRVRETSEVEVQTDNVNPPLPDDVVERWFVGLEEPQPVSAGARAAASADKAARGSSEEEEEEEQQQEGPALAIRPTRQIRKPQQVNEDEEAGKAPPSRSSSVDSSSSSSSDSSSSSNSSAKRQRAPSSDEEGNANPPPHVAPATGSQAPGSVRQAPAPTPAPPAALRRAVDYSDLA